MDNDSLILTELERARNSLLDLTMRNRLLNHRPSKSRTIRIVGELSREVYSLLVIEGGTMEFLPRQDKSTVSTDDDEGDQTALEEPGMTESEQNMLWQLPTPDLEPDKKHTDKYLQTNLEAEALQKRLFKVSAQAKLFYEEQGYSILYLALGFLRWKESRDSVDFRKAPLILVPVELDRLSAGRPFRLKWTGDDVLTNISLQAKLKEQFVYLPEFEMPDDKQGLVDYFASVSQSVKKHADWGVLSDIYLDFFSFAKFIMYRDLDPNSWSDDISPANNKLIRAILDPSSADTPISGFDETEIDEKLSSKDMYHVMDADPSQIAVIEDIKAGRNLVVEGPPGTGKSQTITNVIAELIAAGKTVLFVSEKMAALKVVKNRMDKVGLGTFCLEIHSNKTKKSEILTELQRAANAQAGHVRIDDLKFEDHQRIRDSLNDYAKALREPFRATGLTPYELLTDWLKAKQHFDETGREVPEIHYGDLSTVSLQERNDARLVIKDLEEVLELLGDPTASPWRGCSPPVILPGDEVEIARSINRLKESIEELLNRSTELTHICGVSKIERIAEIESVLSAARIVAESQPIDRSVLINDAWNIPNDTALSLITTIRQYQSQKSNLEKLFAEHAFNQPVSEKLEDFRLRSSKIFRLFDAHYRSLKREIRGWFTDIAPKSNQEIVARLDELSKCIVTQKSLDSHEDAGKSLFGSHWKGSFSDPTRLAIFSKWIVLYRKELLRGALSEQTNDVVSTGLDKARLEILIRTISGLDSEFRKCLDDLTPRIGLSLEEAFSSSDTNSIVLSDIVEKCNFWTEKIDNIRYWVKYRSVRARCNPPIADRVLSAIESGVVHDTKDLLPAATATLMLSMLRLVYMERPVLREFIGENHEKKIERFHELEHNLMQLNRLRVQESVVARKPKFMDGASQNSHVGILIGEFKKKRRHLPLRKLMSSAGSTIQRIKPCFMMSPLSIAQFLDPRSVQFDAIIFDEASQVKPEDALGALLRGKQLAVLGDTKQLPPTSFFSHIVEEDAAEEEMPQTGTLVDTESILHRCSQCFPQSMLSWHYRSRHESLIAVSNQEFYDNRLLFFPSPTHDIDSLGLKFVHVSNGIYDRGKSQMNRVEAQVVAKSVAEHYYRTKGSVSLGVGTFSQRQKEAIDQEIELLSKRHPDLEVYMRNNPFEPFFVKNLETIQGDERDTIFVSVGYGKTADGTLYRNFGPLNNNGGERRLNVLITRARQKCVVFSNFRAEDLRLDGNERLGVKALKTYLEFAESGKLQSQRIIQGDTESVFEDSVYEFLNSRGIQAHKQVGCSRYWIDLAVIDSDRPGKYVLGIECDGAQYHSSRVARERDRLREQVLNSQGWTIHRVWSTDWFRNRAATERQLLEAIELAKSASPNGHENQTCPDNVRAHDSNLSVLDSDLTRTDADTASVNTVHSPGTLVDEIGNYTLCNDLGISLYDELHLLQPRDIALAVKNVVEVEGPIHIDEVMTRIRSLAGYARAGQRMRNAIEAGVRSAIGSNYVRKRNNFLWSVPENPVVVRRRDSNMNAQPEHICDEELTVAFKKVLSFQGATPEEDLVVQASRVLGFRRTSADMLSRFREVLRKATKAGDIRENAVGQLTI